MVNGRREPLYLNKDMPEDVSEIAAGPIFTSHES